jgi:hypothetical protein
MALTPMQFGQKKEKKTGWENLAEVMGAVNTVASVANGVTDLADKWSKPAELPPVVAPDTSVPQVGPNSSANDILKRKGLLPYYA